MNIDFLKNKQRLINFCLFVGAVLIFYTIHFYRSATEVQTTESENIVGVWFVHAVGAPFQPHLATFHPDKTMEIHNPESGDPLTSDSMGMGPWDTREQKNHPVIVGTFIEINADRITNKYVNKLVVTYTLTVNDDTFTGPAQATYYNPDDTVHSGPFPVILNGKKIKLPVL